MIKTLLLHGEGRKWALQFAPSHKNGIIGKWDEASSYFLATWRYIYLCDESDRPRYAPLPPAHSSMGTHTVEDIVYELIEYRFLIEEQFAFERYRTVRPEQIRIARSKIRTTSFS